MLRIKHLGALSCAVALVLTCASALAEDYPIFGDWLIVKATIAPWAVGQLSPSEFAADSKAHMNMVITFEPDRVLTEDETLACTDVDYERTLFPPEAIFQGSLPDPRQDEIAASLGFPEGEIAGFDVDCSSGLYSFHFADEDTILFALDNVIYTLDRQSSRAN